MSAAVEWWIVILVVGALNYFSRVSFIAIFARIEIPSTVLRALRFVPAAMLTSIVVPAVVFAAPGKLALTYTNPKLIAALIAAFIAWRTKSASLTIVAGMLALWLAQWLLAAAR